MQGCQSTDLGTYTTDHSSNSHASPWFHSTEVVVAAQTVPHAFARQRPAWAEVVSPRQMKGCRANSLPKWAARIIFLVEEAAHDHDISGRVAAQLRHARRATGSRHRCRRSIGDNSRNVGSGDDDSRKDRSRGAAALHQYEQDRLGPSGRARSIQRVDGESAEPGDVDLFTSFQHLFSGWFSFNKIATFH